MEALRTQRLDREELDRRLKAALESDAADPNRPANVDGEIQYLRLMSDHPDYKDRSPEQRVRIARNFAIRDQVLIAYRAELERGIFPFYVKRAN